MGQLVYRYYKAHDWLLRAAEKGCLVGLYTLYECS